MKIKKVLIASCALMLIISTGCAKKELNDDNKAGQRVVKNEQTDKQKLTSKKSEPIISVSISSQEELEQQVEEWLKRLSLEEKIAQLFIVLPEALTDMDCVTEAGEITKNAINEIPVGGFIYMEPNLESADQVRTMLSNIQQFSQDRTGLPAFTCVDEEGGTVTRIGGRANFDVPYVGNMSEIGETGDISKAYEAGETMGRYLSDLGFNVDFAPDADVLSNSSNQIVRYRSFGSDSEVVSDMALSLLKGLEKENVYGTLKHFPGHGATEGDTHEGYSYTSKTLKEIQECELIPFQRGIEQGVNFIMVGHISLPKITGDNAPASLSKTMISHILREQMGYDGIVITDAMNMGAVTQSYSSSEAALQALLAGVDLILMPQDFREAYDGLLKSVEDGTLTVERIDQSVRRVVRVKLLMEK